MRRGWLYGLVCTVLVSAHSGYASSVNAGVLGSACAKTTTPQPSSTIVVVTTNTTPPAFLQELRGDDPKTIQRVAEREGSEAFQKEDAWYLIPRTLLSQSQIARANRILSHLLERLSDEEAPTSFTLDSLPQPSPKRCAKRWETWQPAWRATDSSVYMSRSSLGVVEERDIFLCPICCFCERKQGFVVH